MIIKIVVVGVLGSTSAYAYDPGDIAYTCRKTYECEVIVLRKLGSRFQIEYLEKCGPRYKEEKDWLESNYLFNKGGCKEMMRERSEAKEREHKRLTETEAINTFSIAVKLKSGGYLSSELAVDVLKITKSETEKYIKRVEAYVMDKTIEYVENMTAADCESLGGKFDLRKHILEAYNKFKPGSIKRVYFIKYDVTR